VKRFGYPDQLRTMPEYDYASGPFDPMQSLRFRLERLLKGASAFPYFAPEFGQESYCRLFSEADAEYQDTHSSGNRSPWIPQSADVASNK